MTSLCLRPEESKGCFSFTTAYTHCMLAYHADIDTSVETAEKEQNTESVAVTTKGTATSKF